MQSTLRSCHHDKKRDTDSLGRAYWRFLELPPAMVLPVLWLTGLALVGSCVLALYLCVSLLAGV